jgi:hypothetical protein
MSRPARQRWPRSARVGCGNSDLNAKSPGNIPGLSHQSVTLGHVGHSHERCYRRDFQKHLADPFDDVCD